MQQERFAAFVAHELRTPLTTQRVLLELALGDPNADTASWREIGNDVLRACRQQERLLEACLTLARSRGGPRRREPVDLAAIAADAFGAHDPGALESVVALEPAWTTGDPDLLQRLVDNLVSNAIRHNIAGGRIELATITKRGHAVLSVANTGSAIPASELARLFQPFERLNAGPRAFGDGVGLGLTIVEAIAAEHGASVTADARADGGLEIRVGFPAYPLKYMNSTTANMTTDRNASPAMPSQERSICASRDAAAPSGATSPQSGHLPSV